ncbi:ubiquinone biosynthesis accessory factor UbiJ [Aromatoleum buckelii]|uniref:Ubiquinone biosynthesis accessory factor UbiJ n=1 Tax=Aromatoleum buckelii TaxID=200254 RepID=A0ABX1MZ04_9RHOO|nr:SCP2 sterol-binding domain-containing protein [Aromatoleum buckelii]MCK0510071.1 SCP2 sterol-binding domain-containing protein [Aromatoleum buckelii]
MSVATRGFLTALNHLLAPAPWARERLSPHAGRHALLHADPFEITFTVRADGFLAAADPAMTPSITLSLPLGALPGFLTGDSGKAMSEVRIDGNAEFADALGFVFRNLRWDAEEDLSRVLGDILAHRVMLGAQAVRDGGLRAWQALGGNVAEYLTEEQPLLVTRVALEGHGGELGTLRDDLARLDKRVARLSASRQ